MLSDLLQCICSKFKCIVIVRACQCRQLMETLKIKIEIGDRKFEADGPAGIVQGQVNAFMKLTLGGSAETIAAEAAQAAAEAARAAEERLAEEAARARVAQQQEAQVPAYDKILRIS